MKGVICEIDGIEYVKGINEDEIIRCVQQEDGSIYLPDLDIYVSSIDRVPYVYAKLSEVESIDLTEETQRK